MQEVFNVENFAIFSVCENCSCQYCKKILQEFKVAALTEKENVYVKKYKTVHPGVKIFNQ